MRSMKNILSIDWDYFIKASMSERINMFPVESDAGFLSVAWDDLYRKHKDLINIEVKYDELEALKKYLVRNYLPNNPQIVIADNHKHIYKYVKKLSQDGDINLVNIDFHHDCYYCEMNSRPDCANWLYKLIDEEIICAATWILDEDSGIDPEYPCDDDILELDEDFSILKDIEDIDLIYLCRSSLYSPPHLNKYFNSIVDTLEDSSSSIIYIDGLGSI